jgi:uncharacterized membrane protein YraQ (UPF0718 family)
MVSWKKLMKVNYQSTNISICAMQKPLSYLLDNGFCIFIDLLKTLLIGTGAVTTRNGYVKQAQVYTQLGPVMHNL